MVPSHAARLAFFSISFLVSASSAHAQWEPVAWSTPSIQIDATGFDAAPQLATKSTSDRYTEDLFVSNVDQSIFARIAYNRSLFSYKFDHARIQDATGWYRKNNPFFKNNPVEELGTHKVSTDLAEFEVRSVQVSDFQCGVFVTAFANRSRMLDGFYCRKDDLEDTDLYKFISSISVR